MDMYETPSCERVDSERGRTLLLTGEFDIAIADELRDELRALLCEAHSPAYVDLSGVTFFDSSAVSALLWANRQAPDYGAELVVVNPSRPCRSVIEILGLDQFLKIEGS
jgi:anti-sigma B factor antagonist